LGTYARVRVDGTSVDVKVVFSEHLRALVDGLSRTIEDTTQHVLGHTKLQAVPGKLYFCLRLSDAMLIDGSGISTFLTSIPEVPSKTCVAVRNGGRG